LGLSLVGAVGCVAYKSSFAVNEKHDGRKVYRPGKWSRRALSTLKYALICIVGLALAPIALIGGKSAFEGLKDDRGRALVKL